MAESGETIKVLYNNCYGGWTPSDKAAELYNAKMQVKTPDYVPLDSYGIYVNVERHDPVLVEVFDELGVEFDGKYSSTSPKEIDKKYEKYYYITEYDGAEEVKIKNHKYEVDTLKEYITKVLKSNDTNDEKIRLLNTYFLQS